jgi:hypothetical protein
MVSLRLFSESQTLLWAFTNGAISIKQQTKEIVEQRIIMLSFAINPVGKP